MIRFLFLAFCYAFLMSRGRSQLDPCVDANVPSEIRALYVSKADDVINLGPPLFVGAAGVTGDKLLQWSYSNGFNRLILYGITGEVAANPTSFLPKLRNFVRKAHEFYFIDVSINVASFGSASALVGTYYADTIVAVDPLMHFDALHYEAEYWNPGSGVVFDDGDALDYAPTLTNVCTLAQSEGMECETYIGNPTKDSGSANSWAPNPALADNIQGQLEIDHISTWADRIYVAYYKDTPFSPGGNHFQSKKYRFGFLQEGSVPSDIVVLFNVRDDSPDPNLYSWLSVNDDVPWAVRWHRPYNVWMACPDGYDAHAPTDNVNVRGYAFYRFPNIYDMSTGIDLLVAEYLPSVEALEIKVRPQIKWERLAILSRKHRVVHSVYYSKSSTVRVPVQGWAEGLYHVLVYDRRGSILARERLRLLRQSSSVVPRPQLFKGGMAKNPP